MDLSRFEQMDVVMLLSMVNMKLRDQFGSLEELARYYDISAEALCATLAKGGFEYLPGQNQFR